MENETVLENYIMIMVNQYMKDIFQIMRKMELENYMILIEIYIIKMNFYLEK